MTVAPASLRLPKFAAMMGAAGLVCATVITLANPGATRMYAWPWSGAYAAALILPPLVLLARAFDPRRPLELPATEWIVLAAAAATAVLVSAVASPHRGPSLQWGAPLFAGIAGFLIVFDWLHAPAGGGPAKRTLLAQILIGLFALIGVASIALWLGQIPRLAPGELFEARNPFPLGHSNYTAGLALLMLPTAAAMVLRRKGGWQLAAGAIALLALAMLFTSGSRGGLVGLIALAVATLACAPVERRRKWRLAAIAAAAALAFAAAHPRTRAMFSRPDPGAPPNPSNVQRRAMLVAGWHMGADRPLFGWGPGTTPLVYPRYRAGLEGGVETALQLHSLPAQIWAELGAAGFGCLLAFVVVAGRSAARDPVAAITLAGYGAFSFTDWQLDVPIFGYLAATFAAAMASPASRIRGHQASRTLGAFALAGFAVVALFGRRDSTPDLNGEALTLGREPAQADRAAALLRESLAINPDQEIAHFNLGWLLLPRDPAPAERHFAAAARLVPDKGGVYFGLGLARLKQGRSDAAARAFALECLNDPRFLESPWWTEPPIAAMRDATTTEFTRSVARARSLLPPDTWAAAQLDRLAEAAARLGRVPPGPERAFHRERTGYPVLMRDLDLPPPVDLYLVREIAAASSTTGAARLPAKGWMPAPLLLHLLND